MTHQYETHKWAWYDFKLETSERTITCSECHHKVSAGEQHYVQRNKKGVVMKRVCSEECGQKFDYREMSHQAKFRERGLSRFY